MTATKPKKAAADRPDWLPSPEELGRTGRIARSEGIHALNSVLRQLGDVRAAAEAYLANHPWRCKCDNCAGRDPRDAAQIRDDMQGLAWLMATLAAPLATLAFNDRHGEAGEPAAPADHKPAR